MKNIHEIFNRFHHFPKLILVIMIGSLGFLGACSSDDETTPIVDVPLPGDITAYNFTTDNSRIAAEIAAAAMEFFPTFNQISIAMLEILAGEAYPPSSPLPLLLCTNAPTGSAVLSWNDADMSRNLTKGDTAMLDFTTCDVDSSGETIDGPVNFEAVSVTLPTSVGIDVSLDLTLINLGIGEKTGVNGNFGFTVETVDELNFTNVYTAVGEQTITITENDTPYFRAGCLNVTQTYYIDEVLFGYYNLAASGVINAGNQILSLKSGPAVEFMFGDMYFGTQTLLSTSVPDDCASVGAPLGIPANSDGSYMDMDAPGGGLLILRSFTEEGTPIYTEETFWSALTD